MEMKIVLDSVSCVEEVSGTNSCSCWCLYKQCSTNNLIKIVFGEERKERLNKKELSREEKRSSISSINSRRGFITATSFVFVFLVL